MEWCVKGDDVNVADVFRYVVNTLEKTMKKDNILSQ